MPFTKEDFLHNVKDRIGNTELFTSSSSLSLLDKDDVSKFFGVELSNSEGIAYVPVKMCHSLPTVNSRKRCFTPKTLRNSFASAIDSIVDIEHSLLSNKIGASNDRIVGHIKTAKFDPENKLGTVELADIKSVPSEPAPLVSLVALYLRADGVNDIIDNHVKGKSEWKTSMECGHDWRDSYFYYRGEFIPFEDAPGQLLEGITAHNIKPYKGHEVAAVLGGLDGVVDFWGMALTTSPADKNADILGIFGGQSKDLASANIFRVPLISSKITSSEAASDIIHEKVNELASISVIGETEVHTDGHKHLILSDLTIVPASKHTHSGDWIVTRGTKPSLTGKTGIDYGGLYDEYDRYQENPHLHLISIPLSGKYTSESTADGTVNTELFNNGDSNDMKIKELGDKIKKLEKELASKKDGDGNSNSAIDAVLPILTQLKEMATAEEFEDAVKQAINERIEKGELLTSDSHSTIVAEKVTEKEEEYKSKIADQEVKSKRILAVQEAGISLDFEFDKDEDEAEAISIKGILDTIGTDEIGEKQFKAHLKSWRAMAQKEKEKAEQVAAAEAANSGVVNTSVVKKNTSILAVGSPSSSEQASDSNPKIGKYAFS